MLLTGSDILIQALIEQGVDTVFGYPGGQVINIYDSLYKYSEDITHILTAHEQGAAHAADGFARSTGKPGVVIATSGPGATNLVTGIATAYLDSIPMIAITGNVATTAIGTDSFQEIDITGITLPITKHNYFVGSVVELADTVREAFKLAMSGRPGPVLIDIPKDVQRATCEYTPKERVLPQPKIAAKDIRIQQAAECINNSERPFVYFGGGLVWSNAREEMIALAQKIDAPIGCSMMGISVLPDDFPNYMGLHGMHGHYACSTAMHNSDCIIALGARFNDRVTGNKNKFARDSKIIHIDIDGSELSKNTFDTHALRGDIKETLKKLLPLIEKSTHPQWHENIKEYKKFQEENADNREGLTPKNIINTVNRHITPDTPVATDVGQHQVWTTQYIRLFKERKFISSGGLGTMGFGMGAAIGAYFGTKEKPILITGDGSFGMNLNELATAVKYNIPLVILIMNNTVLGMVRQWQTLFYDKRHSSTTLDRATDFIALARAFGADGVRVDSLQELDNALDTAFKAEMPFVIDCAVGKDEFVLPMLPPNGSMDQIIVKVGD